MPFAKPLPDAIDDLYRAFASVPAPGSFPYCDHCISDAEVAALLAHGSLRSVPEPGLAVYTSNLVVRTVGSRDDARYYLPRILEIIVGQRQSWPELPMVTRFLATATDDWPQPERDAIGDLIRALWLHRLTTDPAVDDRPDIASILCAAGHLTGDLGPYLHLWTTLLPEPHAAGHLSTLLMCAGPINGTWRPPGPWWNGPEEQVDTWLNSDELRGAVIRLYRGAPHDTDALDLVSLLVWSVGIDTNDPV